MDSILLPKCTGIAVFDQANEGAQEAAEELGTERCRVPRARPPARTRPGRSRP